MPTTPAPPQFLRGVDRRRCGRPTLRVRRKLLVCTHLAYKPFQYKDDAGKVLRFDVDVMDLVAEKLGVTQEIVDIEFEQITSGAVFAAKKCDAGAAAITITDKRKLATNFSDPYFAATQALLVKSDSTVTDLSGLKGKVLAVQSGTTGQDYAEAHDYVGYTVKVFDDMPGGANAVLAGTVDATSTTTACCTTTARTTPRRRSSRSSPPVENL